MASYEQMLSDVYRDRQDLFENEYLPLIEELEKKSNSNQYVDEAKLSISKLPEKTKAMSGRMDKLYQGEMTQAQKATQEKAINDSNALAGSATLNNARSMQKTHNAQANADVMNITNQLINQGTADLSTVATNEAKRKAEYEASKGGFMSSALGLVGGIAGAVIGGPVGAAAGAGIGSSLGRL